jgi:hypothetical protein
MELLSVHRTSDLDRVEWRPLIFNPAIPDDMEAMEELKGSGSVRRIVDVLPYQLGDLFETRRPRQILSSDELPKVVERETTVCDYHRQRWVFYPWTGDLVRMLAPGEFSELRLDRNRVKITSSEQQKLAAVTVGVVGLSVGNAIATTLALEAVCGHLKLADFDVVALSNMNRLRAAVSDIGLSKCVLTARQIFEFNPYARISIFCAGITDENIDDFLCAEPRVNVVVEECDDLRTKFLVRERARAHGIAVVMETTDRGMIDVERFDCSASAGNGGSVLPLR